MQTIEICAKFFIEQVCGSAYLLGWPVFSDQQPLYSIKWPPALLSTCSVTSSPHFRSREHPKMRLVICSGFLDLAVRPLSGSQYLGLQEQQESL
jgi:hypothetical protein